MDILANDVRRMNRALSRRSRLRRGVRNGRGANYDYLFARDNGRVPSSSSSLNLPTTEGVYASIALPRNISPSAATLSTGRQELYRPLAPQAYRYDPMNARRIEYLKEKYMDKADASIESDSLSQAMQGGDSSTISPTVLQYINNYLPVWGQTQRPPGVNYVIKTLANENLPDYLSYPAQTAAGLAFDRYVTPRINMLGSTLSDILDPRRQQQATSIYDIEMQNGPPRYVPINYRTSQADQEMIDRGNEYIRLQNERAFNYGSSNSADRVERTFYNLMGYRVDADGNTVYTGDNQIRANALREINDRTLRASGQAVREGGYDDDASFIRELGRAAYIGVGEKMAQFFGEAGDAPQGGRGGGMDAAGAGAALESAAGTII